MVITSSTVVAARHSGTIIPPIYQLAYRVPDLDEAVAFWVSTMRVGPFKMLRHIVQPVCEFLGNPADVDLSIALAWRGGLQIELMQVHRSSNSVFDAGASPATGLHHVGIKTNQIGDDAARLVAAGFRQLQRGISASGTETIFLEGPAQVTGLIELIHVPNSVCQVDRLRLAAETWNGMDPFFSE